MKKELIAFVLPSPFAGSGGWGNGYVAIPKEHPYFGVNYNDIDDIDINGGLTYSDSSIIGQPSETKGMWIVGFDTLHSWDNSTMWPNEQSVMKEAERLKEQLLNIPILTYKETIKEQSNSVVSISLEDAAVKYGDSEYGFSNENHHLWEDAKRHFKAGAKFRDEQYSSLLSSYRELKKEIDDLKYIVELKNPFQSLNIEMMVGRIHSKANNILSQFNQ
jgi:hypothetical protein